MAKSTSIAGAAVLGAVFTVSTAALANPVTDADLRGKKICWTTGIVSTYNKDGSYDSNRVGHGNWRLVGDQIMISAEHGAGSNTITKDGDTFHTTRRASKSGQDVEGWGKYCN